MCEDVQKEAYAHQNAANKSQLCSIGSQTVSYFIHHAMKLNYSDLHYQKKKIPWGSGTQIGWSEKQIFEGKPHHKPNTLPTLPSKFLTNKTVEKTRRTKQW